MLKEKLLSVPFYGQKLAFSGPTSFKLATSEIIFGENNMHGQTTGCYFVLLELRV